MKKKILFLGKKNCKYSRSIASALFKKHHYLVYIDEDLNPNHKVFKKNFDYIFMFRNKTILNKQILKKFKKKAINFHPGPPTYRGIGCINQALINNEKFYGVTAHLINEKIDNGPIIQANFFKILKKDNLESLLKKTHYELFLLTESLIFGVLGDNDYLNFKIKNYIGPKWSKRYYSKIDLEKIYILNSLKNNTKLCNFIRSTYIDKFYPIISIRNEKYRLKKIR